MSHFQICEKLSTSFINTNQAIKLVFFSQTIIIQGYCLFLKLFQEDVYNWSDYEKREALSSYHWLSWLSILPGSVLGQKFGSKIVLGYSLFISAVMSSIIPFVAQYGAKVVAYIRMIQGFFSVDDLYYILCIL